MKTDVEQLIAETEDRADALNYVQEIATKHKVTVAEVIECLDQCYSIGENTEDLESEDKEIDPEL